MIRKLRLALAAWLLRGDGAIDGAVIYANPVLTDNKDLPEFKMPVLAIFVQWKDNTPKPNWDNEYLVMGVPRS